MSIKLMSAVWELDLPPGEKLVLLALADQANDAGVQCWPSVATIAKRSGQGERTVRRALADLEKQKHLTRNHRDGNSTQYHVHPCHSGTPAKSAPLPNATNTPAKLAGKPSGNTIGSEAKASSPKARKQTFPAPPDVPDEVWADFLASPARHKAGMSNTAYSGIKNKLTELAEHGFPPGEMIALAVERGWKTVRLEWVQNEERQNGRRPEPISKIRGTIALLCGADDGPGDSPGIAGMPYPSRSQHYGR